MADSSSPSPDIVSPVTSSAGSTPSSITIQNIGSMVPIKLTTTNYLTWSALFAPIFRRYNLTGIIDGSQAAPPKYLCDSSGNRTSTLNPAFVAWYENDQNILIWINSTLSDSLIPYTVGVASSRELWAKLESRLATASHSHIHELRSRLRSITKGDASAASYLQRIEEIVDALASAGAPIDDSELISVILHGLPPEFDSFVDAIQFRIGSTTIDELHGLLLSKEIQIENRKKSTSAPTQAFHTSTGILPLPSEPQISQAYVAQHPSNYTQPSSGRGSDRSFSNPRNSQTRGNFRNNNQRTGFNRSNNQKYNHNRGSRFNNSGYANSGRRITCQICKQFDHEAIECPQRLNPTFGASSPSAFCANNSTPQHSWLLDSGASSHMTNSYAKLQNPESYTGPEQVYIGDGKGLPILHLGSSSVSTSSHCFNLKNVLHVPDLKQDLLSANKFILDNQCSIHLYPFHFTVNDLSTEKVLFKGLVQEGFYPFQTSIAANQHVFAASSKAPQDIWHQRLGHPSSRILNKVASHCGISFSTGINKSLCSSCAMGKCSKLPFSSVSCSTSRPLELIHTDIWGPSPTVYVQGFRYYIIFVDDYTKYCWFFPLTYKSEAFLVLLISSLWLRIYCALKLLL